MKIPNYNIIKEIGSGGMGTVYLAEHTLIKRKVAIKSLKQDLIKNEQLKERFKKEATALAQLEHPNIVRLNEYIEQQDGIFLIMEYVEGLPLDEHINKVSGPINEEELIPMFCELLDAFEYAHNNKIIHRDIKPSNIIVNKDGYVKVLDFGIAKIMDETNSMTKTGTQMGSIFYMSPEQVKGQKVNNLSDIYSLGVTLFQMGTGKAPYDPTSNEYEVFQKIDKEPLPNASTIYPGISEKINDIIQKATSKNVTDRFQSCKEFKDALRQNRNIETTHVFTSKTVVNKPVVESHYKNELDYKNKKHVQYIKSRSWGCYEKSKKKPIERTGIKEEKIMPPSFNKNSEKPDLIQYNNPEIKSNKKKQLSIISIVGVIGCIIFSFVFYNNYQTKKNRMLGCWEFYYTRSCDGIEGKDSKINCYENNGTYGDYIGDNKYTWELVNNSYKAYGAGLKDIFSISKKRGDATWNGTYVNGVIIGTITYKNGHEDCFRLVKLQ
jgi:serine/threonine protein kinase